MTYRKELLLFLLLQIGLSAMAQNNILQKGVSDRWTKDSRTIQYILPSRIVWMSDSEGESVLHPENLLSDFSGQITVASDQNCILSTRKTNQAGILLDFGKELHGGLLITAAIRSANHPIKIRVRFGESVTEAMSDTDGNTPESSATNDHAMRDFEIELPWLGSLEIGNTGFRFVRIDLLEKDVDLPHEVTKRV